MEIKILCPCGAKYKFDVEPIGGAMPWQVKCPVCNQDGTPAANDIIRQTVGVAPPAEIAPPPSTPTAPPPPPSPAPGGLRLGRPTHQAESAAPRPTAPSPARFVPAAPAPKKSPNKFVTVATTVVTIALVCFGAWRFGSKWYRRIKAVGEVAQAIGDASVESEDHSNANLDYSDCLILFVKQTNHLAVADACKEFWNENYHKSLTLISIKYDEGLKKTDHELFAAHNGWVRYISDLEWPAADAEKLAGYLSQKLDTTVVEMRDVDFSGAFHFGVYENGTKKFHAKMDVSITNDDAVEKVATEGDDWAIAHGFKPGPEGFKAFHIGDADAITKRLGMKMWDEEPDLEKPIPILREL